MWGMCNSRIFSPGCTMKRKELQNNKIQGRGNQQPSMGESRGNKARRDTEKSH